MPITLKISKDRKDPFFRCSVTKSARVVYVRADQVGGARPSCFKKAIVTRLKPRAEKGLAGHDSLLDWCWLVLPFCVVLESDWLSQCIKVM